MEDISWAIRTTVEGTMLRRTDENGGVSWVPEARGNRHYEEYLEWVSEGNEPKVIDETA
jgi:hypothetical protein